MLQGLVTGLGAVPGLLPTPATPLHSPRKSSRSPGGAQEESRGRGSYEGTITASALMGTSHGMGTLHGRVGTRASTPGEGWPPMRVTSSRSKDANPNTSLNPHP